MIIQKRDRDNELMKSVPHHKVILFNRYVKEIERREDPNVIIIEIPGGIIPYNNEITHRFGITAFLVSNAITPDASIFSVPFENYKKEFFETIATSIRYKLGFEVDCFNMSNVQFDWFAFHMFHDVEHLTLDYKIVDLEIKIAENEFFHKPVFNILNSSNSKNLSSYIYNELAEYGTVEAL